MMKVIYFIVGVCANVTYYTYNASDVNTSTPTNPTTISQENISCTCDLTQNQCDTFCCCDTECNASILSQWSSNNVCQDLNQKTTTCYKRHFLYGVNDKFGIEFTKTDTEICLKRFPTEFNFSSEYYTQKAPLTAAELVLIKNKQRSVPVETLNTSAQSFVSNTDISKNFTLSGPNGSGVCDPNKILFKNENIKSFCFQTTSLQTSCQTGQVLSSDYFVSNVKVGSSAITSSNRYQIVNGKAQTESNFTLLTNNSPACTCEALRHITYYVTNGAVSADIYTESVTSSTCSDTINVPQSFSLFMMENTNRQASLADGYDAFEPLNLYYEVSNTLSEKPIGFFLKGVNADGTCSESSTETIYNPLYDQFINVKENKTISCRKSFTDTSLASFCVANSEFNLDIFGQLNTNLAIGSLGATTLTDTANHVTVDKSVSFTVGYDSATTTCTYPRKMNLAIVYQKIISQSSDNGKLKILQSLLYFEPDTTIKYNMIKGGTQNFDFNLNIKYLDYDEIEKNPYFQRQPLYQKSFLEQLAVI